MSWRDKPSKIELWCNNIDYAMFIDENGSESKINMAFKAVTNNKKIDENDRYFTITGCIFERKNYKKAVAEMNALKNKYWGNGFYHEKKSNKEKYVCFHSREIRRHDGAFNDRLINHNNFINDLTIVLENAQCTIISITIDLLEYIKHGYLHNVYETAFDFLLERYIYATKNGKKGIIMLEARGKSEDKDLLKHILTVLDTGKKNIPPKELKEKIVGVYFNPKWNEEYSHTFSGLEFADLFSYPIHQFVKYKKENSAFEVLKTKIDKYPYYEKKGIKIFPNKK